MRVMDLTDTCLARHRGGRQLVPGNDALQPRALIGFTQLAAGQRAGRLDIERLLVAAGASPGRSRSTKRQGKTLRLTRRRPDPRMSSVISAGMTPMTNPQD